MAARGAGVSAAQMGGESSQILPPDTGFQASVGYRWFQSDSHYVGDEFQKIREQRGDQVINNSNFIDLGLTYSFTPRYSLSLTIPFVDHDRSQVVKDPTIPNPIDPRGTIIDRFHTQASGLADIRVEGNAWIFNPKEHEKWNLLTGLGLVVPSGDRNAVDTFEVYDAAAPGKIRGVRRAVDQSIQPGGGGWGIMLDLYAFYRLSHSLNAYLNGGYVITPEQKYRPDLGTQDYSISDTYYGRTGLEYSLWPKYGLSVSLGGRVEGVAVHDLVGGSEGFRRPGYAVSVEPGVAVNIQKWSFNVFTPVAVYRNRERSVLDQMNGSSGGDAAFSDFSVLANIAYRF